MRRDQGADPLVVEQAADECGGDRTMRLGRGMETLDIDAGAWNELDARRCDANLRDQRTVIGVLHERDIAGVIDQEAQDQADGLPDGARLDRVRNERIAKPGDGVDRSALESERRHGVDHDRFDRDTVHQRRFDLAMDATQIAYRLPYRDR